MLRLAKGQKPFRVYPDIEEWKEQYGTEMYRYKFLVLVGPSRMGKTQLARHLLEPAVDGEILEVNCASGEEPGLRRFQWSRHKLVLFDEVHAKQVSAQMLLFQACASDIMLACSATKLPQLYHLRPQSAHGVVYELLGAIRAPAVPR